MTNNELQDTTLKTKDRAARTPLKTGGEFRKGKQFLLHWWHPSCCSSYKREFHWKLKTEKHEFHWKLKTEQLELHWKPKTEQHELHWKLKTKQHEFYWRLKTEQHELHWKLKTKQHELHWKLKTEQHELHWKLKIKQHELHWKLKTEQHELHWKLAVNSGRESSSWSTGAIHRVAPVTNPVISHEWGKTGKCSQQVEHIRSHL
jgi:acetyl/propionyl-CoA carboxylase alpha subunit